MLLLKRQMLRWTAVIATFFPLATYAANETPSSTLPKPTAVTMASELKPHVGLIAGVSNPEGGDESRGEYGLDIGYQPYIPFGLGVEMTGTQVNETQRTAILVRGTYNFGGTTPILKDSYVGLGIGPLFSSDGNKIASAPVLGFDIPVTAWSNSSVSLGLNAKYLVIEGSTEDALSAAATLKYWY